MAKLQSESFYLHNIKDCRKIINAYKSLSVKYPEHKNTHDSMRATYEERLKHLGKELKRLKDEQKRNN